MKLFRYVALCLLMTVTLSFAQGPSRQGNPAIVLLDQGYMLEVFEVSGYAPATGFSFASFANGNPAALVSAQSAGLGANFGYRNSVQIFSDIEMRHPLAGLPLSAGFAGSLAGVHAGIGFYQRHYSGFDFGELPLTSPKDLDGNSSQTSRLVIQRWIFVPAAGVAKTLYVSSDQTTKIAAGVQVSANVLRSKESLPQVEGRATDLAFSGKIGVLIQFETTVTLGATIENGPVFEGIVDYQRGSFLTGSSDTTSIFQQQDIEVRYQNKEPWRAQIGASLQLTEYLNFDFAALPIIRQGDTNRKNDLDLAASVGWRQGNWKANFGGYALRRTFESTNTVQQAYFMLFGIARTAGRLTVELNVADSHLISDEDRQYALFKLGFGYAFRR